MKLFILAPLFLLLSFSSSYAQDNSASKKVIINTDQAPSPIGPYNQSVRFGDLLFVSGQGPIDPTIKGVREGLNIEEQTDQVLKNLGAILNASGLSFEDVVKVTVYISDLENFQRFNKVYAKYFDPDTAPAREIAESKLPFNTMVEISLIAGFSN